MLLYHGTNSIVLEKALRVGLRSRRLTRHPGHWDHTIKSHINRIYFTDAYAPYFAECAVGNTKANVDPVVIVIDTVLCPQVKFVADEDAIEQVERHQNYREVNFSTEDIYERTKHFARHAEKLAKNGFTYEASLGALGTCAAIQEVPKSAIVGYVKLHRGKSWFIWDPTITLLNYALMKTFYRHMTELMWLGKSITKLSDWDEQRMPEERRMMVLNEIIKEKRVWDRSQTPKKLIQVS